MSQPKKEPASVALAPEQRAKVAAGLADDIDEILATTTHQSEAAK